MGRKPKVTERVKDKIVSLYQEEVPVMQIGKQLKLTRPTRRIVILKRIYSEFQKYPNWGTFEI